MKPILPMVTAICCVFWTGCADPEEKIEEAPAELGQKLEQGLTGHGEIVPIDRANDPFIQ